MDNQTVFFILGPCLVAVAVIVSFVGLRFDKFPGSRLLLVGATVGVAVLVVATMTFAWRNASDEQTKRDAELASNVAENEQSGNTTEADEEAGSQAPAEAAQGGDATASTTTGSSTTGSSTTAASTAAGKQVFAT